ncbi:MAG: SurA N-terminal domain-containing protein [Synergistaceae bacterium]|nr:SurA N-terminal domain-containing protein [Synergistaceae bacterium]
MMKFLRTQMKWIMALIVIAFLLSTFFMYEGRTTRRTPGRNADGSMSDYEVAQINGRSLMRSELEQRLRNYLSNYGSRSAESLDMPALYKAVLDEAVLESQLTKELDESGIRISDAEADQAMKDYADRYYATRETFYQALANSGIKVDDYKRQLARQMATEQLFRNAIGEVVISEDQATQFYDTMKALIYSKPEGFMVHMSDFNNNEAAEGFRAKLLAGESWDVIVSSDVLASKDLINITRAPVFLPSSAMTAGTLSVMASLDVGVPSEVFSVSSSDFAVGLKTSHVDASVSTYDEVSADIKNLLTNQEQRKRLSDYEASLRNKAQLVINDEELFASPAVSVDETPSIIPEPTIEIIEESEDVKPEETKPEETTTEATTTEEAKPEEAKPEETVTEEVKQEETSTEEVKSEETPTEEPKPEETTTEEVKPEETPSEEAKPEETVTEEVKPEETTTEEPNPEETVTEEVKADETVSEEIKPEETPAVEAEIITQSQDIPLQEEVTEEIMTEAVSEEKTAE